MSVSQDEQSAIIACIEAICHCGCDAVRATMTVLEQGGNHTQCQRLTAQQRLQVLRELKAIMAVYDAR
ncbi:MAG: hypothetical protein HQL49_03280 [Gammaproteobacteria bacterium]|nr:hypothetical protein [Gammaproteobacteria bacterium]